MPIGRFILVALLYFFLSGCRVKMDSIQVLRKYSADELLYFKDIAFGYPDKIKKWNQPIKVTIIDSASREDYLEVKKVVTEIARLVGSEKISFTPNEGNLRIHFPLTTDEFERQKPVDLHDVKGYAQPDIAVLNTINQVDIYINPYLKGRERCRTLRHEFCHGMGLWGHSKRHYSDGRLLGIWALTLESDEPYRRLPVSMPAADGRAIQLLYEEELPIGLSQSAFAGYLTKLGVLL